MRLGHARCCSFGNAIVRRIDEIVDRIDLQKGQVILFELCPGIVGSRRIELINRVRTQSGSMRQHSSKIGRFETVRFQAAASGSGHAEIRW